MKSKTPSTAKSKPKKLSKPSQGSNDSQISKLTLFDHVKHIRSIQDPNYFKNLSEENRKSFNHFMLLRALAMDDEVVGEMAFLFRYFDKIPSEQFYKVLIALVPKGARWVPWVKSKVVRHSQELIALIAKHYECSKWQANQYINVYIATDEGLTQLLELCQSKGLNDPEVEALFDKKEK